MGLYQRDFILRMIEAVGATLRRALRRRQDGDVAGARQDIAFTVGEVLGPSAAMVPLFDSSTAADLVSDPQRLALYAQLLETDAELLEAMGEGGRAAATRTRALELLLEVVLRHTELPDETILQTRALLDRVGTSALSARYRSVVVPIVAEG